MLKQLEEADQVLDDFLFNPTETEIQEKLNEEEKKAKEENLSQFNPEFELDGDDLFKRNLEKTIQAYEKMLEQNAFKNEQDRQRTNKLLGTLRAQLRALEKKQTQTEEERQGELEDARRRGVEEIFHFYSRQHIPQNRQFDDLKELMTQVDLGEFMSFCKDFGVPLGKPKLTEIFKKSSVAHKPHKIEQFMNAIDRIGFEMNRAKADETKKRLQDVKKEIRRKEAEQRKKAEEELRQKE